ncbi:MAG: hypothetical protein ACM30I_09565 [Gemmatimonas sp.]
MRKLAILSTAAAVILLSGGLSAQAQQTAAPSTAKGAGAECSRMTDAKMRDDCVRQAREHDKSAKAGKKGQTTDDTGAAKKDADTKAKGKRS